MSSQLIRSGPDWAALNAAHNREVEGNRDGYLIGDRYYWSAGRLRRSLQTSQSPVLDPLSPTELAAAMGFERERIQALMLPPAPVLFDPPACEGHSQFTEGVTRGMTCDRPGVDHAHAAHWLGFFLPGAGSW